VNDLRKFGLRDALTLRLRLAKQISAHLEIYWGNDEA
jgi:hypothetical protein